MQTTTVIHDSRTWTGEEDYVEVEAMPAVIIIGSLLMLLAGLAA